MAMLCIKLLRCLRRSILRRIFSLIAMLSIKLLPEFFFRRGILRRAFLCAVGIMGVGFVLAILTWTRKSVQTSFAFPMPKAVHGSTLQRLDKACVHPKLDPFHPSLRAFIHDVKPLDCGSTKDWVYVEKGRFRISPEAHRLHGNISCHCNAILFSDDFSAALGATVENVKDGDPIVSDFFQVECRSQSGRRYVNVHAAVAANASLQERHLHSPLAPDSLGLDVLMFGFDSVSKMSWIRKLPKTREYFLHTLGGLELDGYNIVGDGTPAALLPILTGSTEEELPEARRGHKGARPVDGHPWIWKEFQKQGYVTMWGEDSPSVGTFHYRMLGFKRPPVDHYIRTFYLWAERMYESSEHLCLGSISRHNVYLNWYKHGISMYRNKRKFLFSFYTELSHDDSNLIQAADEDFLGFLRFIQETGQLDNAVLILMSDHGRRYSNYRSTVIGKLEERMPYFAFRFPPWFETKYPDAMRNFRSNMQRLTTPFDIHETLRDILHFSGAGKGNLSSRGISLFREIPKERTCAHAGAAAHWCACLAWQEADAKDPVVQRVARLAVATMNSWTETVRARCVALSLSEVFSATKYTPGRDVLRFKESKDHDGRVADLSDDTQVEEILLKIDIATKPNSGRYELTLRYSLRDGHVTVQQNEVSRMNKYGHDPDCVAKEFPHLRKYCYCHIG